ncbi:MAG TPA: rhomboid family intramembrane serine protease, partial [Verrucomicrobiae bacterium]|nr:rhomboid family intramembrane serine protease [Verrucomicrobiae bacterium]
AIMRLIGHLPSEATAAALSDFLLVEGIGNEIEQEKEGWAVWIHSEDEWRRAKEILTSFLANPADPRFLHQAGKARQLRQQAAAEAQSAEERVYDRRAVFRATMPYSVGALTLVIVALCVALSVLAWSGHTDRIYRELLMTKIILADGAPLKPVAGLPEIRSGEFWRLLTPAFVHTNVLHLLFNMLWLLDLGSMIESRLGTGRLGLKIIVFGIFSNLAQFLATDSAYFYGLSGVNYGLFGYMWVRGSLDPRSGLYLHPHTVALMVIWFFVCLMDVIPNLKVANMAHAAGFGLGIVWGFFASLPAARRRAED